MGFMTCTQEWNTHIINTEVIHKILRNVTSMKYAYDVTFTSIGLTSRIEIRVTGNKIMECELKNIDK
jgi:hypothetical protein